MKNSIHKNSKRTNQTTCIEKYEEWFNKNQVLFCLLMVTLLLTVVLMLFGRLSNALDVYPVKFKGQPFVYISNDIIKDCNAKLKSYDNDTYQNNEFIMIIPIKRNERNINSNDNRCK